MLIGTEEMWFICHCCTCWIFLYFNALLILSSSWSKHMIQVGWLDGIGVSPLDVSHMTQVDIIQKTTLNMIV